MGLGIRGSVNTIEVTYLEFGVALLENVEGEGKLVIFWGHIHIKKLQLSGKFMQVVLQDRGE